MSRSDGGDMTPIDELMAAKAANPGKWIGYYPHQSTREKARRMRQMGLNPFTDQPDQEKGLEKAMMDIDAIKEGIG